MLMSRLMDLPFLLFVLALALLFGATRLGTYLHQRRSEMHPEEREDLGVVLGATLTLLAGPDHRIQFLRGDLPV